jgi:glucose/arabinose dehydrogenase
MKFPRSVNLFFAFGLALGLLIALPLGRIHAAGSIPVNNTLLDPPTLVAPADASAPPTLRPAFDWDDSPGATKYNLQVSRNDSFSLLVVNVVVVPSNFTPAVNLPANISLFWRVRAVAATYGPWSSAWQFTSPNPPSIPGLVSPGSNALVNHYTPVFNWANSALPVNTIFDHYQIQVDNDSNFSSPVIEADTAAGDITDSDYTPPSSLTENTRYYWHVRSYNLNAEYSAWSAVWSFRAAILPPVLDTPVDGAPLNVLRPTFDWEDVAGAASYLIQVSRVGDFSSNIVLNVTIPGAANSTYTPTVDLPMGTTLFWRVRAYAAAGNFGPGGWSGPFNLTTPKPPSIPMLLSPLSNALITSLNNDYQPKLDWKDSTVPLGGSLFDHYQIQLATANTFASTFLDADVTASEFSDYTLPGPLVPNTKYYWHVRAWDNAGNSSSWSVTWTLRAAMLPPNLVSPADLSILNHVRPTLDWDDVTGISITRGYTLQVSRAGNFSTMVLNVVVTPSSYTPAFDLPVASGLYWRVRANGPNGPSLWSEVHSFTTGNPPSVPALVGPANFALVQAPSPMFDWKDSTLPAGAVFDHYQIQVATDSGFTNVVYDNNLSGMTNSHDGTAVLAAGTLYYWHVRSVSLVPDYSAWSAVRSVRLNFLTPTLDLQPFAAGFSSPVYITNANDGSNRIFVVEKCGTVKIIEGGSTLPTDFLDISGSVSCGGERGLLSIAFPPNFVSKQYFYAFYAAASDGTLTISRFSVPSGTPDEADASSEQVILTIPHPATNHNGGQLAFGNDGYLYISIGDGGGAGDPNNNAQNANVLLGKILRIDVEGGVVPYAVPPTNPFVGVTGKRAEIWALGLRNPWRLSFDRLTHDLYIGDVGQNSWEEVDFQPASGTGGKNYGWRRLEGNACYNGCGIPANYSPPVATYSHDVGCAITGGFVYRGSAYPDLQGFYVYSDFCSGNIWLLRQGTGYWFNKMVLGTARSPSTFGEDEQGNLYLGDLINGTIYTIEVVP